MKVTYSVAQHCAASVTAFLAIRKLDSERIEQAVESELNRTVSKDASLEFGGVHGRKTEEHWLAQVACRMPEGVVSHWLRWNKSCQSVERQAKKAGGVFTVSDSPATLSDWLGKFTVTAEAEAKAKAKAETKAALEATRQQVAAKA